VREVVSSFSVTLLVETDEETPYILPDPEARESVRYHLTIFHSEMQERPPTQNSQILGGWLLAIVALALRLGYILAAKSNPTFWAPTLDPQWYDEAAQAFAQGSLGQLPFFRAPLYSAVLGAFYYLLGHHLMIPRLLDAVVQSAAVWTLFRVGYTYFSPIVAWVAAGLLALNGLAIYFSAEIVTTNFEILAAVCALWATLRALRKPSTSASLVCGLAWGIAALTRPNFLLIVPLVLVLLWYKWGSHVLRQLPLWALGIALPIAPITLINWVGGGEFVLLATQGGVNFWIGNNPYASGVYSSLPGIGTNWTMHDADELAAYESGRPLRPGELSDFYYRKGLNFIASAPLQAAGLLLRKTLLFLNHFEISNNKHLGHFIGLAPWLPPLTYLNFALLIPLALLGAWVGRRSEETRFVLGFAVVYAISVILFFIAARFRMPVVPALALLAAIAVEWGWRTFRQRPALREFAPMLLLVPGCALAFINPLPFYMTAAPDGWAYFMEGNAYMKLNQPENAEESFHKALKDMGVLPLAHVNLGILAAERGDLETAEKEYRAAIRDDSLCVKAWNNLGTIEDAFGDTAGAIADYSRALSIRPYMTDAKINLAGIYFRAGTRALRENRDEEAAYFFSRSLQVMPGRVAATYNLAVALGRLGRQEEAMRALAMALTIDPNFEPARTLMEKMKTPP
jgi:tetratricopeptide (TPR) repeat protein